MASDHSSHQSSIKSVYPPGVSSSLSKALETDLISADLRFTRTSKSSPYGIYGGPNSGSSSSTYGTKSNRKSSKTQFSEMAKCMLEILDDLQPVPQTLQTTDKNYKHLSSIRLQNSLLTKRDDDTESIDILMKELSNGQSDTSDLSDISSISYRTLPEQHIYEEILYDCLESSQKEGKLYGHYVPPHRAIDRRVDPTANGFAHSVEHRVEAPIHQSHIRHVPHVGSWGRTSNKPKQRSNLYTIFADESERRNICRSLEREFSKRVGIDSNTNSIQSIQTAVDNYGFKA